VPIGDEVEERFATKVTLRAGAGYRLNARQRIDPFYMPDREHNTLEEAPTNSARIFNLRYRVVF
jgi:hypothetical protein